MTIHDPAFTKGGTVQLITGPFGAPERTIVLDRPMAIAEVVAAHGLAFRLPTIAVMAGEPVLRGSWALRVVRPGEVLNFVAVPRGGGENSGTGKQLVGMIAALALSVAAPMIGGFLFGAGTLGASLASAAILVGGGLLLNAVFPPPQAAPAVAAERVYSVSAANNQATPLEPLPTLYGRVRFAPRHASRPYAEYRGNDQYLYQLFLVTTGKADIAKIEIGDTEAWNSVDGYSSSFTDLAFEIVQPGQDISLFPANVVTSSEVSGQPVPDPPAALGPFVVNSAGTTVDRLAVDFAFPGGLFTADNKGVAANSIALRAQYQAIDAAGDPVGGWANLFAETISASTRTPQRMSREVNVAPGRYQVRFLSDEAFDADDGSSVNAVAWTGLRGYLTDFVTPPNATLLAMKIRASEQLSQTAASQIRVTAERYLPVWSGTEWVEQKTRSIAWAAADLLMNWDYSLGLPSTTFSLAQLIALDATWQARGDTFNALFDRSWTVQDVLRAILRAGRAQAVRQGGRIGFVRLEPKSIKRAVFSPRNVVRGSFRHQLVLFDEEKPDHVVGSYIDEVTWQTREVVGSLASIGADAPQKVEWFGITDHDQAWRETVTEAAVNAYQREFVSFTAEWEGKLLTRGDPILVQHPFLEGVEPAALAARDDDVLTLDRDLESSLSGDAYVILRGRNGREWGPCLADSVAGNTITLNALDRSAVEAGMGALEDVLPGDRDEPAHVLVCDGEMRPFNGLVVSASPSGTGRVEVTAVIDAPEVYLADATEVMPSPWTPPMLPPQNPARPLILGLYAALRAGIAQLELEAMWQPTPGAIGGYVAEVSYDADAIPDTQKSWTPVYQGAANRFTVPVLPQALTVRVAPVGILQGAWTKRVFAPSEVPTIVIEVGDAAIEARNLAQELQNERGMLVGAGAGSLAERLAEFELRMAQAEEALLTDQTTSKSSFKLLRSQNGKSLAAIAETRRVVAEETKALAELIDEVAVEIAENLTAGGLYQVTAEIDGEGASATILQKVRAAVGDVFAEAVIRQVAEADGLGGSLAYVDIMADRLRFISTAGGVVTVPFQIVDGEVVMMVSRINVLIGGRYESEDGKAIIDMNNRRISFSSSSS